MPPIAALLPLVLLALAFVVYCLRDLARSEVALLPRWAWAVVIVASVPMGGILYFALGKKQA